MIDLRSDTVTRPSKAMRDAMVNAPVGDDVLGDDPTVKRLEAMAAERAGKEAAIFTPSGSMANLIALCIHTRKGDEVLQHEGAHPFNYEAAGAAAVAGVQIRPLPGHDGLLDPDVVIAHIRPPDDHFAPATLLTVEDTANKGGGTVHPLELLDVLAGVAHQRGLKTHLDGARVFNAVVQSGIPLDRRVRHYDTVSFCFSKGLGAPVGSVLCGPAPLMAQARRVRKMLGGGMRQSGMLAAAAIYALEHNVDRLEEDHTRAMRLSIGLSELGLTCAPCDTNLLYVYVPEAPSIIEWLRTQGVLALAVAPDKIRMVTHLDVDDAGIDKTLAAFRELL